MLGKLVGGGSIYITQGDKQSEWVGTIPIGKGVVDVEVLAPIAVGSSHFEEAGAVTPVLVSDIRAGPHPNEHTGEVAGKIELQEVQVRRGRSSSGAAAKVRCELPPDTRKCILNEMLREEGFFRERVIENGQSEGASIAWACTACTCLNVTAQRRCGVCGAVRTQPALAQSQALFAFSIPTY